MFNLRMRDVIKEIKSIKGETYYLRKSAFGFGEEYTFYDKDGNELESFSPNHSDGEIYGFYELTEKVLFDGVVVKAEFSEAAFYDEFDEID